MQFGCSGRSSDLYLGADQFALRKGHCPVWSYSWFYSFPSGECWESGLTLAMTTSFWTLPNSSSILNPTILSYGDAASHTEGRRRQLCRCGTHKIPIEWECLRTRCSEESLGLRDATTEGRRKLCNDGIPFLYSSPNIIASEACSTHDMDEEYTADFYLVREDIF